MMLPDKQPKVSVCVITYNHGHWLHECLESIVNQITDFPFEIIVGDDCSTDNISRDILRNFAVNYPNMIIPLFREANMGGFGTNNLFDVMSRARGIYLAHIDGDDRMLPHKLQKQSDFLDNHPDCTVVAHDLRTFDGRSGTTLDAHFTARRIPEITDINFLVLHRCYFGHSSKMFRHNAIISKTRDKPTVDFFLHIEHASKGNIGYINEVLGEYRKSGDSNSNTNPNIYLGLVNSYHDAFDQAIRLGVAPNIVARGRMSFNYSAARIFHASNDGVNFKKYVLIDKKDYHFATWKHILLSRLHCSPTAVRIMIRLYVLMDEFLSRLYRIYRFRNYITYN